MEHISNFENNVQDRMFEIRRERSASQGHSDMRPASLFMGIALGALFSRVACICKSLK